MKKTGEPHQWFTGQVFLYTHGDKNMNDEQDERDEQDEELAEDNRRFGDEIADEMLPDDPVIESWRRFGRRLFGGPRAFK